MSRHSPIHYFVCSDNLDKLHINNVTKNHTIVEYFDSEDDVNLAKFAEIVKSKPDCVQKHFIVYKDNEHRAVETDNVKNTFVISSSLENRAVLRLTTGKATIDTLIEEEKNVEDEYANPERQPGFKLRSANGKVVPNGGTFCLEILRDSDDCEVLSEEEDEDNCYNNDWVAVNNYMGDGKDYFLFGQLEYGESFGCETIDGIVYLKYGDGYLYFDIDDGIDYIFIGKAVPAKEQRVQIHYAKDGNIHLTRWGCRNYVSCEWVKSSYGAIGFGGSNAMKLQLIG
ncbi:hypothetical protein GGH96_004037 [Coemansia sp. RSA 1972]|nr:hypothetical protein GGH96_004037 [Coemansia sp. RSA 1972]